METIRLGLEWALTPPHTPFLVAMDKGWFADAGIDFTFYDPKEPFDPIDALEAGTIDVAVTEPIHLVRIGGSGKPVIGFARYFHTDGGVMYIKGRGIERPRDIAGKRVQDSAAPAPGGLAMVKWMAEADGGSCDVVDLTRVEMGFRLTDALAEDKADVATLVFANYEPIEARHRGLDADFFSVKDWGIPDFCQLVLITTKETLGGRGGILAKMVAVLAHSVDFIDRHADQAKAIFAKHRRIDSSDSLFSAVFEATSRCFVRDFAMTVEYYAALQEWMLNTGQIERAVDPSTYWSNDLLT